MKEIIINNEKMKFEKRIERIVHISCIFMNFFAILLVPEFIITVIVANVATMYNFTPFVVGVLIVTVFLLATTIIIALYFDKKTFISQEEKQYYKKVKQMNKQKKWLV